MSTSFGDSPACFVLCLVACITYAAYYDGRQWHLQLLAWAHNCGYQSYYQSATPRPTFYDDAFEGPEVVLLRQLSATGDANAAGALHAALSKISDSTGSHNEALHHLEMARDRAIAAAKAAPPPSSIGNGERSTIIDAGRGREGLAEARLALARAYLTRGRASEANDEITKARNDEAFVGLEWLLMTEIIREQGHTAKGIGHFEVALHHYKIARSRVERSADGDGVAADLLKGILEDEASIANLVPVKPPKLPSVYESFTDHVRPYSPVSPQPAHVAKGVANVRTRRTGDCAGGACTDAVSFIQKSAVVELAVDRKTKTDEEAATVEVSSFSAKVGAMLRSGQLESVEKLCLDALSAGAHDGKALNDLEVAVARNVVGKIYLATGRLTDAREQLQAGLEAALKTGSADTQQASDAYLALHLLQTKIHREGTERALVATEAIYRDAQMAAYEADVPESENRKHHERKLRANARPRL